MSPSASPAGACAVRLVCALGSDAGGRLLSRAHCRRRCPCRGPNRVGNGGGRRPPRRRARAHDVQPARAARDEPRPRAPGRGGLARRLGLPPSRARRGHLRLWRLATARPAGMLARLDRGRRLAGCRSRPAAAPRGAQRCGSARSLWRRRLAAFARAPSRRPAGSDRGRHPRRAAPPLGLPAACRLRSPPQPAEDRRSTRPARETRSGRA